jgi:hypothetical protein
MLSAQVLIRMKSATTATSGNHYAYRKAKLDIPKRGVTCTVSQPFAKELRRVVSRSFSSTASHKVVASQRDRHGYTPYPGPTKHGRRHHYLKPCRGQQCWGGCPRDGEDTLRGGDARATAVPVARPPPNAGLPPRPIGLYSENDLTRARALGVLSIGLGMVDLFRRCVSRKTGIQDQNR